jgi:hypothetical protein
MERRNAPVTMVTLPVRSGMFSTVHVGLPGNICARSWESDMVRLLAKNSVWRNVCVLVEDEMDVLFTPFYTH